MSAVCTAWCVAAQLWKERQQERVVDSQSLRERFFVKCKHKFAVRSCTKLGLLCLHSAPQRRRRKHRQQRLELRRPGRWLFQGSVADSPECRPICYPRCSGSVKRRWKNPQLDNRTRLLTARARSVNCIHPAIYILYCIFWTLYIVLYILAVCNLAVILLVKEYNLLTYFYWSSLFLYLICRKMEF